MRNNSLIATDDAHQQNQRSQSLSPPPAWMEADGSLPVWQKPEEVLPTGAAPAYSAMDTLPPARRVTPQPVVPENSALPRELEIMFYDGSTGRMSPTPPSESSQNTQMQTFNFSSAGVRDEADIHSNGAHAAFEERHSGETVASHNAQTDTSSNTLSEDPLSALVQSNHEEILQDKALIDRFQVFGEYKIGDMPHAPNPELFTAYAEKHRADINRALFEQQVSFKKEIFDLKYAIALDMAAQITINQQHISQLEGVKVDFADFSKRKSLKHYWNNSFKNNVIPPQRHFVFNPHSLNELLEQQLSLYNQQQVVIAEQLSFIDGISAEDRQPVLIPHRGKYTNSHDNQPFTPGASYADHSDPFRRAVFINKNTGRVHDLRVDPDAEYGSDQFHALIGRTDYAVPYVQTKNKRYALSTKIRIKPVSELQRN